MSDFFISLNSKDKTWGDWIAWQLREAQYSIRYQHWDFQSGENFLLHMQEAARDSQRILAVLSDNYFESDYAMRELTQAVSRDPVGRKGIIVPVRVAPCHIEGTLLGPLAYIDLVGRNEQEAREALLEGVKKKGPPPSAPAFPGASADKPQFPPLARGGLCRPALGELAPKLCDRAPQTGDFTRYLSLYQQDPVQIFVIHGEADQLPESFVARLRLHTLIREVRLQDDPDEPDPVRWELVDWPLEMDFDRRCWGLVNGIYNSLGAAKRMDHQNLSPAPLLEMEALRAFRLVVLEHTIPAARWDAAAEKLLAWYRRFWSAALGRPSKPRFRVVVKVIYDSAPGGWRRWLGGGGRTSLEKELASIFAPAPGPDAGARGFVLERLGPVTRTDVEKWFETVGLHHCLPFKRRQQSLDDLFGMLHKERKMADVEDYLQKLLEGVEPRAAPGKAD